LGSISELYASILRLDEEVRDFRLHLPAERRFGEFLSELSQCLEDSAVTDYAVQPKPVLEVVDPKLPASLRLAAGANILPVNVSFQGTFGQAFAFLSNVETLPRLVRVESFRLVNNENHPGKVKVDMTLHTYQYANDHPGRGSGP
jgi:Tfp pilus assembly protein PilO